MKRLLLLFVLVCLGVTIALAQVTTDSRVNNASVISAPNGIIVIDIAKPDSNGLSNNTYTDFNIPTEGVVFNNNFSQGRSRLAGIISSNSNYSLGDAAHLILNQVTSNNSSSLGGFGEVFGSKAGVIIANPNGITCSGCGFINASRVDLVTGTSQFDSNNNLTGFSINQYGKVSIIGAGLNGSEVNYLNLVSRYHDIQAQITAQTRLRILSGNQTYNSNNFTLTSNTNTGSGFAVDISALSNLQAGSIVIIGTEAGLGINSQGNLISIMQNVEIDSAGRIILNKITSSRDIVLKSTAEITTTADSYLKAGGDVNIDATGISLNSVLAYGDFTANTDGNFSNSSILRAENFDLRAFTSTLGDITADGNFSLRTQSNTIISGDLAVLGDAVIETNNLDNSGDIYTNSLSIVVDDNFSNYKNIYTSSLDITSKSFFNEGSISANHFNILARDRFLNSLGSIHSSALDIITASFRNENQATITANNLSLNLHEDFTSDNSNFQNVLFNSLELIAANNTIHNSVDLSVDSLIFVAKNFTNSAKLHSNNLDITAYDSFDNTGIGGIQTNNFHLTVSNDFYNDAFHSIRFENLVLTASSDFHNNVDIISDSLSITAGGNFYNNANITANDLDLKTKKNFYNNAKLIANFLTLATSSDFYNRGTIQANILGLEVGEDFTHSSNGNIYTNYFVLNANNQYNYGNISADSLNLNIDNDFDNYGNLIAQVIDITTADHFRNYAKISANEFYATAEYFDNSKDITANLLSTTTGRFQNQTNATITTNHFYFYTDYFANNGNIYSDNITANIEFFYNNKNIYTNNAFFNIRDDFENKGDIEANVLNITVTEEFKNIGNIYSNNFSFITNSFENDVSASIQAIILDFTADELTNKGNIQADNLNIYSSVVVNNRGSLRANNFSLTGVNFDNTGDIFSQNLVLNSIYLNNYGKINASILDINANTLNNQSNAEINAKNFITNSTFISNYGEITADNFNIITDYFANIDKAKISASTLDIGAGSFTNTSGAAINVNNLSISAGSFTNTDRAAINVNNLSISANSFTNTDRAAISVNNLSIGASYFYNDANIDASEGTILTLNFQNLAGISANALSITVFDDGNSDDTIPNGFDNSGDIRAGSLNLTIANNFYNHTSGDIQVGSLYLTASGDYNYGKISASTIDIVVNDFYNDARGTIQTGSLGIDATDSFDNRGNISTDNLYLNYDTYSNTGSIVTGDSFNQTISNIIIDTPIIPTISTIDIADISAVDTIVFSIPTVTIDIPIVSPDTATIPITPQNLSYSYTAPNFNSLATFDIQPLAEEAIYDIESRTEFYEFSEIITDGSTTTLIYQPDGRDIQVINIAKPDANGLSNNSYSSFHIPSQGIVFNNSNILGISTLAGALFKNSNYSNTDSASLILNQITSNNISFLEGYAEVFGDEAGIIIANPNGIICSGCGFLNTNRVDLITGTSNFNSSGEITNFNIDNNGRISIHEGFALIQGEVIQRAGLDEASIDYLNLVSRYHSIQAQITAKERIQILSGNYKYDYTNSIVDSTTATNSANGEFAVDISALGNLQAGSIFFKATEAGLGIRSNGNLISSVTGVSIDSAGKLHLGNITSTQGIRLNSTAEITTSANSVFQARKNIDIKATDITLNSVLTQEDFNANADGIFESNSDIRARNFNINSQTAKLGGDITIDNNLNLTTQANTSLIGNLAVLGDIHITADSYNQSGRLHTNQNLYLTLQNSASFEPNSILNSSQFMLKAANFYNSGNLNASTLDIQTTYETQNNGGAISARILSIIASDLNNQNKANISASTLDTTITNRFQNNDSAIRANDFYLTADDFYNQNNASISASTLDTTITNRFQNDNADIITNSFNLNTNSFSNQNNASISSANTLNITITNNTFQNNDSDIRANDFYLTADDFYNQNNASISASTLDTTITNRFQNDNADIITNSFNLNTNSFSNQNNASISSANNFNLNTNSFNNQDNATIYAFESEFIIAGDFANEANIYGNKANIIAENLDNKGIIGFTEDLTLSITNNVTNYNEIQTGGRLTIESNYFTNNSEALVASTSTTDIQTTENFINRGVIYSFTDLILTAGLSTDGVTYFKSNDFLNEGGWIEANRDLEIHSNHILNTTSLHLRAEPSFFWQENNLPDDFIFNKKSRSNIGDIGVETIVLINSAEKKATIYYMGTDKKLIESYEINTPYTRRHDGNIGYYGVETGETYLTKEEMTSHLTKMLKKVWIYETGPITRTGIASQYGGSQTTSTQIENPALETNRGKIYAGNNIVLAADGDIANDFSYIRAGGDLHITGDDFQNNQESLYASWVIIKYGGIHKNHCSKNLWGQVTCSNHYRVYNHYYDSTGNGNISSIVDVGGTITGNLKNKFTNGEISTGDVPNTSSYNEYRVSYAKTASIDVLNNQNLGYNHEALKTANSPLFTIAAPSDDRKYAIETRLVFVDLSKFFGSEYFFRKAGFDPNEHAEVLGDAFWEQQHILEEITRLAASAYLADNSLSPQEIMKLLLDGAIEVKDELNLTSGVALTKEQTDRLTKDIVWYVEEEITINGVTQKYLVPRLYLAKVTRAEIDEADGSIISARNVDITVEGNLQETMDEEENALIDQYLAKNSAKKIAADVQAILTDANVGVVKLSVNDRRLENQISQEQSAELDSLIETELEQALQDFNFATTSKILEIRDEIEALEKEIETIEAHRYQNSGRNKNLNQNQISSSIRSKWKKIDELRQKTDELTTTKFDRENYTNLIKKSYLTTLDRREQFVNSGTIRARDGLTVHAGNHINNHSKIQSGTGGISLAAEGNVNIESQYVEDDQGSHVYGNIYSNASLNTKGDLQIIAGQDINITAADVNVEQNANLTALTGNLTIESIGVRDKRTSYGGSTTTITDNTIHQRSNLDIGGNLNTFSRGDTIIQGAEIKAGGDANLTADGGLYSIAVHNTYSKQVTREEDGGSFFTEKYTNKVNESWNRGEVLSNSIETGGDLSLSGKQTVLLQATDLTAGEEGKNNINLTSEEGTIEFDTATKWDSHSKKTEGKGILFQTNKGGGHSSSTQKDNNLQGNIKLSAKEGVKLSYVKKAIVEKKTYTSTCYKKSPQGENTSPYSCNKTKIIRRFETDAEAKARLQKEGGWQSQVLSKASDIELTGQENTFEDWSYNTSGLTQEGALAVAIAISVVTGGAGATLAATMVNAAAASLYSVAAVNGVNAVVQGNNFNNTLHQTAQNTLTEDNLRNAAIASISAGVTYGIDAGVEKWGGDGAFKSAYTNPDTYLKKAITTTTNTGVKSLVHGESGGEFWNNLGEAYKTLAIDTAAEKGANWIGDQYVENRNADFNQSGGFKTNSASTYLAHKASHALLGCAVGAAKSGDCASGAFGGVVGEIVAEELANTSLGNNLVSPDAKKRANAKKTISTISQITSLFSASAAGLDFKTAQQTAKNAAENNRLELNHTHSIQSLKVLVALNTYLVDQGKDNNSFVIEDAGGASFVINGESYSLTDGILVGNRSSTSHHNLNKEGGNNSAGGDISMIKSTEVTQEELVNALKALGIGRQTLDFSIDRGKPGRSRIGCPTCVKNSQIIYGYGDKHLHFGSPNLSNGVQEYVDKIGNNSFLEAGSENNNQYNMFNADGVGFFKEKNWLDPSKYYGDSWSIPTRQNFNSQQDIKNLLTTPKGEKTQQHQSQLNFQNKFFVDPANNYQASPNKK